jgi:hypothetical protein
MSAARKVTRKQKDIDEETKKIGKREDSYAIHVEIRWLTLNQSSVEEELSTFT